MRTIKTIPALQELGGDVTLAQLGISDGDGEVRMDTKMVSISQAQKLKMFMKMTRSDPEIKK